MLSISTRIRYGSRALVQIAEAYPDKSVSVSEVARAQRLSPKYLEHIMSLLKAAGLVRAVRGMRGGYELARAPGTILLSEVFEALEGSALLVECIRHPRTCGMYQSCPTRDVWVKIEQAIQGVLQDTTLQDLLNNKRSKITPCPQNYAI